MGENLVEICETACREAKKKGLKISCDLNYRGKLWSKQEANRAMSKLCKYVDICIANEEDAKDVFGIEADNSDAVNGQLDKEGYKLVALQLKNRFDFDKVAITLRKSINANENKWGAMLYENEKFYFSKEYDLRIVDRVGGGDSFGAGLIYSCMKGMEAQKIVDFAVAASALKHSIEGDFNRVSVIEVEKLLAGDQTGRVQR